MTITPDRAIIDGIPHVFQYQPYRSRFRGMASALAALSAFARPGTWHDLDELAHQIQQQYAGNDDAANTNGLAREQALDWLARNQIGVVDLQEHLDRNDMESLRQIMAAMNRNGIPQLLLVADDTQLVLATNGAKLHNWRDGSGENGCLVRLGLEEHQPVGYYLDPACPCPPFPYPTPIEWKSVLDSKLLAVIAVMPSGVDVPPADFNWFLAGVQWPQPKPVMDLTSVAASVAALSASNRNQAQRIDEERQRLEQENAALVSILQQIHPNLAQ